MSQDVSQRRGPPRSVRRVCKCCVDAPASIGDYAAVSDYLHECLERHGEVSRALYGSRQDLQAIERLSARVVDAGRLRFEDVEAIKHAGFWHGRTFWQWPTHEEFKDRCETGAIEPLWSLPKRRNAIVDQLLGVFRHIEPVSVVLRFIDPENFGILSAPVEKILEVGPAHRPRQKYLKYVTDLRSLRRERLFNTTAEVDMALWVMSEVIDANRSGSEWLRNVVPESDRWISGFWEDRALREIRVANLTSSLFGTMTMPQFAEALVPRDARRTKGDQVHLAGRIAAIEFEAAVMQVSRLSSARGGDDRSSTESLAGAVRTIQISDETRDRWIRSVRIRNAAVHGDHLKRNDVEDLICAMRAALDLAQRLAS